MGNGTVAGYKNAIKAPNIAALRRFIIGNAYGTLEGLQGTVVSGIYGNTSVTIGAGEMIAYGYVGKLVDDFTFDFQKPTFGVQVWQIYGEIDLSVSPNEFNVKCKNNGASKAKSFRQDVLSVNRSGVFQLPLCQLEINQAGETILTNENNELQIVMVKQAKYATVALEDGVTATTQSSSDNSNKVATTAFVRGITG